MAFIMLVFSVSPILAPLTGSALIVPFGWRAVFIAVMAAAIVSLVLAATLLPETRPPAERRPVRLASLIEGFGRLLRNSRFLGLTFIAGFALSGLFTFLAGSSFVYIEHFGLTPTQYSLAFSVNAIGFIGSSQFAAPLGARYGAERVVKAAVTGHTLLALALFALTAAGVDSIFVLAGLLFAAFACLGLVVPSSMSLALDDHGPIAGMAAALGGALQMLAAGAVIVVMSLVSGANALPMVTVIAGCALCGLFLAMITLNPRALFPRPAE
jgi:DHA1 family bicyclomycin/chloramphenicol resistance-like MFS transporter